jgi:hypothetical protein
MTQRGRARTVGSTMFSAPNVKSAADAENILTTVAPPGTSRNLGDYIDMSLTNGLRAEGFFDAMARKYGGK